MKNITGIWLDLDHAVIITWRKGQQNIQEVHAEIEDYHVKGGSRSKKPYGPQDNVSENKYLERKKHQLQSYFNRILALLADTEELYVFGPAKTKNELYRFLVNKPQFRYKPITVETADIMTQNQMVAKAKKFFGIPIRRKSPPRNFNLRKRSTTV